MVWTRSRRWGVRLVVYLLIVGTAGWYVYDHYYRIPGGPALPPSPLKRTYAQDVIDLNNRGTELHSAEPDNALVLYDRAIKLDPDYFQAYANKVTILVEKKRYEEALNCFEKLVSLKPRVASNHVVYAFCLERLGRPKEAKQRLMFALSAYNARMATDREGWVRFNRAMVLFLLGRDAVAKRELTQLCGDDPQAPMTRMASAMLDRMKELANEDRWSVLGLDRD